LGEASKFKLTHYPGLSLKIGQRHASAPQYCQRTQIERSILFLLNIVDFRPYALVRPHPHPFGFLAILAQLRFEFALLSPKPARQILRLA
jgi:hypothetical protein